MATQVNYTGDGVTVRYPITFDFQRSSDLKVYLDDTLNTAWTVDGSDLVLDAATTASIDIVRETDITDPIAVFSNSSTLFAEDINRAVEQTRHAIEEFNDAIELIQVPPGGGGGASVPTPTTSNQFIVSSGAGTYAIKTLAETKTLLGISGATTDARIPTPSPSGGFLIANGSSYTLTTAADTKTALGISTYSLLPNPTGLPQYPVTVNNTGTGYTLRSAAEMRTIIGLGSAATYTVGTSVGQLPALVSTSGGPGLPAVSGLNLTGVGKEPGFVIYEKSSSVNSTSNVTWTTASSSLTVNGATSSWATTTASGVQLSTGVYRVDLFADSNGAGVDADVRLRCNGGTTTGVTTIQTLTAWNDGSIQLSTYFTVSSATTELLVEFKRNPGSGTATLATHRLFITKVS